MSDIKIQPSATGSGTVTITAPTTNTARVITLPDSAGTLLDENSSLPAANLTGTIASARLPTSTDLPLSGGTMTGATLHGDNIKSTFGAGNDLHIYHDGTNSVIDSNTGRLYIQAGTSIRVTNSDNTENYARFNENGSCQLYYDNAQKISTTSTGVTVTGALTTGSMNWSSVTMGSSNSQSVTSGVDTTITWGTERYDRLNEMDTSGRFTASVAGTYLVSLGLMSSQVSWGAGTVWYTVLYLNGAVRAYSDYSNYSPVATYYRQALLTQTVEMTAGQYLEVSIVHTRGAATTIHNDANHSHLSIQRVA